MEVKRVAIYTRISPNPDKDDTTNQDRDLIEFINRSGWELVKTYIDISISGSKKGKDRPEFSRMMKDASQKKFDIILFWSLDRLSREGAGETLEYLTTLNRYGIDYKSYTEPFFDSCGIFKEAIIAIIATLAKQERIRIIERTIAGLKTAVAKGIKLGRRFKTEKTLKNPNPINLGEVIRLHGEGISSNQISKTMKCSNSTISKIIWRYKNGI